MAKAGNGIRSNRPATVARKAMLERRRTLLGCSVAAGKAHAAGARVPESFCLCHGLICNPIFGSAVVRTGTGTVWTMEGRNLPAIATVIGYGFYWLSGMIMSEPAAQRQCLLCWVPPRVRVRIRQRDQGFKLKGEKWASGQRVIWPENSLWDWTQSMGSGHLHPHTRS